MRAGVVEALYPWAICDISARRDSKPANEAVTEYLESKKKYEDMRKQKLKKGSGREAQTMALLERFKSKLSSAISETPSVPEEDVEELGEDDDRGW
ncbi:hypothetical protein H4Q32_022554 [Labeo rohita]|uniref:Uncharacterized protein n=1 Tax=Labeo rohita TaxID=84645 RepID=A0ABQ8MAR0_LABRO|nr:hypothetical protein H4Q32_022554 [Labeo rohita]